MKTPEVRKRLRELAEAHNLPELSALADELKRRSPVYRGKRSSPRMTPERAIAIKAFCDLYPDMSHREIGKVFNVDGGRVSEILNGKRV